MNPIAFARCYTGYPFDVPIPFFVLTIHTADVVVLTMRRYPIAAVEIGCRYHIGTTESERTLTDFQRSWNGLLVSQQ